MAARGDIGSPADPDCKRREIPSCSVSRNGKYSKIPAAASVVSVPNEHLLFILGHCKVKPVPGIRGKSADGIEHGLGSRPCRILPTGLQNAVVELYNISSKRTSSSPMAALHLGDAILGYPCPVDHRQFDLLFVAVSFVAVANNKSISS